MDKSEKATFNITLLLTLVIIVSSLIIFILTPSPISPTKRYFGYIKNAYSTGQAVFIEFDRAEWLADTEKDFPATRACIKDKNCPDCPLPVTKSCLSRSYYIKNPDPDISRYSVAGFTKVGTLIINPDWKSDDPESKPYLTLTLREFVDIYSDPDSDQSFIKSAPYDITVIANQVIIINQHYIP